MRNLFRTLCMALFSGATFFTYAQIPSLNSHPSSAATLFLDFDGHTVSGTSWNGVNDIICAPSGLTNDQITEVFNRVSEDYRPFDLNITTDSTVFLAAPIDKRTRVIITVTNDWYPGVGGISFIGSFTWGDDSPCFVFSAALLYRTKYISEAVSHEAGHTLGLYHQAVYDQNCNLVTAYNTGTGSGEIGWAPIMGVGYYQNMTLWNDGPVPYGCTETQNDLSVITTYNGFGYRDDDYGNSLGAATSATFTNNRFNVNGVIEKNTDQDVFRFILPTDGKFKLDATPYNVGINNAGSDLDLQVTLYDNSQTAVAVYNPGNTLSLAIDTTLNAGTYYTKIEGKGNQYAPNYASLGSYSLQASFIDNSTVLPVHKLELSGKADGNKHDLTWLIEADENIISQSVEISTNGHDYSVLATLSPGSRSYNYIPGSGETLLYRIHVKFDNGKEYYTNIISLRLPGGIARPQLRGNVITDHSLHINSPGNYNFRVTDLSGKTLSKGLLTNGSNTINTAAMAAGMYFISFTNGKEQWTEKFVMQ
ncbi:MAG: T9SS type A sorting domain-containing protein [Bacteroidetes bacterium]|nr:T9SS type A sorting domain-containing protein [Bacteroidota bacterium]